jgi:3-oxoacyl-[acyl-carrier-protein] synthase-1
MTGATLPRAEVVVVGVGARTATGLTALSAAMTWRAGKSTPRECHMVDRAGAPIAMCRLASIGDDVLGAARLVPMAAPALREAAEAHVATQRARLQIAPKIPAIVAVPDVLAQKDARGFLERLAVESGIELDLARSEIVTAGRAGGAAAIEKACARLTRGEDEAIVVGGVDTHFDPDRLEALDTAMRLHGPACENGFIPGEAAAFALLGARRRIGARALAQIAGASTENEPRPYGSAEPCQAIGVTVAAKRALAPLGKSRVSWALSDVVGERHRVEEFLYATGRLHDLFEGLAHDQPLMKTGDVGAASATLLLVIACVGFETGFAPANATAIFVHSDEPLRGVLAVTEEPR